MQTALLVTAVTGWALALWFWRRMLYYKHNYLRVLGIAVDHAVKTTNKRRLEQP